MMDTNNNDFFGEIKEEEFENTNISSSGISYGETPNKLSTKTALLTIATSAVIAAVVIALLTSGNSNKPTNNFAEIPTISSPSEPIKIVPEDIKVNEVFEQASIYNSDTEKAEAKTAIPDTITAPEAIPEIKTIEVKKMAPKVVKPIKKEPKYIEKATNVNGEVEISRAKQPVAKTGNWNVQITSTSSETAAKKEWMNLVKKYPNILQGQTHTISKTEINGKILYRLRVSNLASSNVATELCNKLKANKVECFITK